jgi:uncharacterized Zn finger protein
MEILCQKGTGIFPGPKQIEMECSCPDGAWLCKHLAATLYGVGVRLDHEPELLFVLRGVETTDLLGGGAAAQLGTGSGNNVLKDSGLGGLFGIELEGGSEAQDTTASPLERNARKAGSNGSRKKKPALAKLARPSKSAKQRGRKAARR